MLPVEKPNFNSIAGTIIMLLLCVIGYFLSGVYTELKEMRNVLTNILVTNGQLNKDVETLKNDQSKIWTKMSDYDAQILKYYQEQFNKQKK
jgi:hypothetical protein